MRDADPPTITLPPVQYAEPAGRGVSWVRGYPSLKATVLALGVVGPALGVGGGLAVRLAHTGGRPALIAVTSSPPATPPTTSGTARPGRTSAPRSTRRPAHARPVPYGRRPAPTPASKAPQRATPTPHRTPRPPATSPTPTPTAPVTPTPGATP